MLPKKKKGFRKIIIGNETYNWRFSDSIEIRPEQDQSNRLEIDLGSFDPWLYVNDPENKPEEVAPRVVTPAFIRQAIENAIRLGWTIEAKNTLLKLNYRKGLFKVSEE